MIFYDLFSLGNYGGAEERGPPRNSEQYTRKIKSPCRSGSQEFITFDLLIGTAKKLKEKLDAHAEVLFFLLNLLRF